MIHRLAGGVRVAASGDFLCCLAPTHAAGVLHLSPGRMCPPAGGALSRSRPGGAISGSLSGLPLLSPPIHPRLRFASQSQSGSRPPDRTGLPRPTPGSPPCPRLSGTPRLGGCPGHHGIRDRRGSLGWYVSHSDRGLGSPRRTPTLPDSAFFRRLANQLSSPPPL